ncbi:Pol polyprotein [Smittium mucronatum]|uniref:Pol polyprotein n=1 Tax=Smittium mucronatum TaxID=133383 RepID=A0A1R0GMR9_9FUNG|nr:Pol polyprotein [Smittium mucronatum]
MALDFLLATDPDITDILRDVAELFNPSPSAIKTNFPHQLRLATDQYCRSRMRRYSPEKTRRLNDKGFKLNSKKCLFAVPKVEILGFTVPASGQEISPSKIEALKNFTLPNSVITVRRFIGISSFCRSFIDKFTEIAVPLYKLLEKETGFNWNFDCESTFQALIIAMTTAPVLAHPDTTKSYVTYTDASNIGIGTSLHLLQPENTVRLIA